MNDKIQRRNLDHNQVHGSWMINLPKIADDLSKPGFPRWLATNKPDFDLTGMVVLVLYGRK